MPHASVEEARELEELIATLKEIHSELQDVADILERGCSLYCSWFDGDEPRMDGSSVAYEMVSAMRHALAKLKG